MSAEVTNCRSILQEWNLRCVGILWKSECRELHLLTASQCTISSPAIMELLGSRWHHPITQSLEGSHHPRPGQRGIHLNRQRLSRVAVHQVQPAKFPTARPILGEVHRTHLIVDAAVGARCPRPACVCAFSAPPPVLSDIAGTPARGSSPNLLYATALRNSAPSRRLAKPSPSAASSRSRFRNGSFLLPRLR